MNLFLTTIIISVIIALLASATRSRQAAEEPLVAYALKITVISFVAIYFGMMFLNTPSCPDFHLGDPDF